MSATSVEFTPAVSAVLATLHLPTVVKLPPPDPATPAMVLKNLSHNAVFIKAGGTGMLHPNQPGTIMLHGQQVMLTTDAGLATAAEAIVQSTPGAAAGTGLSFTRGSLRDVWLFLRPTEAVF